MIAFVGLSTIYVPKVDDLACCCSDVTITLCFMGSLGIILKNRGLAVILKEGFKRNSDQGKMHNYLCMMHR